jgi:hypothetical protein
MKQGELAMNSIFRQRVRMIALLVGGGTLLTLAGCGGGGAMTGGVESRKAEIGDLGFQGTVIGTPVTAGEAGSVVTGVTGAISSAVLRDGVPGVERAGLVYRIFNGNYNIAAVNSDGTNDRLITQGGGVYADYPDVRRTDGRIVFESNRLGQYEIYSMNADGTDEQRLTFSGAQDFGARWSADGTRIVFHSNRDGNYEIYAMNADGSGQIRLTNNTTDDAYPAFSADGTRIAFHSIRDGNYEIYAMNADGSGQTRLTNDPGNDFHADWSPDGSRIAWHSDRSGTTYDIWVMDANGANQKQLNAWNANDTFPAWSPDGSQIAFSTDRFGPYQVMIMNADGSNQRRVTQQGGSDNNLPRWFRLPANSRTLIGSGGTFGASSGGFLFAQTGRTPKSFVSFDANPRTSIRLTSETGLGNGLPNIIFRLTADLVNVLSFIDLSNPVSNVVRVIGAGGTVASGSGAIVSFDSATGQVSSVLPYSRSRDGKDATVVAEGNVFLVKGEFLGAWNEKGVNLAERGASEIRIDKDGKIVDVR